MNVITKLMYSIHRILGTLLCILFLMWFLSAFVMMYHRFPRVSAKEKMQKLEMLSQAGDSLPDISSVTARLPRGVKVRSTILNLNAGHPEFSFSTTKGTLHFLADSTIPSSLPLPKKMVSLALRQRNIFRHLRTDLQLQRHDVSGRHSRMDS